MRLAAKPVRAGIVIGLLLLLFAAVIFWQITRIPSEPAYARIGPALIPLLLGFMVLALSAAVLAQSALGRWQSDAPPASFQSAPLLWLAAGLLINLLVIAQVGFILASTALFLCTARGFGSRRPVRDALFGFVLALLAYLGFDRLLGYEIGDGLIENLF
jgi:putative tricarboxylic transport membrane protein